MPRWSRRCAVFSCFAFSAFVDRVICHKYITSYDDNQRLVKISNHQLLRGQIGSYLLCTGSVIADDRKHRAGRFGDGADRAV